MRKRAYDAIKKIYGRHVAEVDTDLGKYPVLCAIVDYAAQNAGLEWGNYATTNYKESYAAYDRERRKIGRDWDRVKQAIKQLYWVNGTDADILAAMPSAYSGRLAWINGKVEYCTGQYWPTEYRQAVAAVIEEAADIAERRRLHL